MAKLKCLICKKKLSEISQYNCSKCNYILCIHHLNAPMHNCTYDYKQEHRNWLSTQHIVVVADKLPNKELM
jgi:hypothetical protein